MYIPSALSPFAAHQLGPELEYTSLKKELVRALCAWRFISRTKKKTRALTRNLHHPQPLMLLPPFEIEIRDKRAVPNSIHILCPFLCSLGTFLGRSKRVWDSYRHVSPTNLLIRHLGSRLGAPRAHTRCIDNPRLASPAVRAALRGCVYFTRKGGQKQRWLGYIVGKLWGTNWRQKNSHSLRLSMVSQVASQRFVCRWLDIYQYLYIIYKYSTRGTNPCEAVSAPPPNDQSALLEGQPPPVNSDLHHAAPPDFASPLVAALKSHLRPHLTNLVPQVVV